MLCTGCSETTVTNANFCHKCGKPVNDNDTNPYITIVTTTTVQVFRNKPAVTHTTTETSTTPTLTPTIDTSIPIVEQLPVDLSLSPPTSRNRSNSVPNENRGRVLVLPSTSTRGKPDEPGKSASVRQPVNRPRGMSVQRGRGVGGSVRKLPPARNVPPLPTSVSLTNLKLLNTIDTIQNQANTTTEEGFVIVNSNNSTTTPITPTSNIISVTSINSARNRLQGVAERPSIRTNKINNHNNNNNNNNNTTSNAIHENVVIRTNSGTIETSTPKLDQVTERIFSANNAKLTELILSALNIVKFPAAITLHSHFQQNLTYLDLSGNQLQRIPGSIGILKQLSVLNLSRNEISSLPLELINCRSLVSINLAENPLQPEVAEAYQQGFTAFIGYLERKVRDALNTQSRDKSPLHSDETRGRPSSSGSPSPSSRYSPAPLTSSQTPTPSPEYMYGHMQTGALMDKLRCGLKITLDKLRNSESLKQFDETHFFKKTHFITVQTTDGVFNFREYTRDVFRHLRLTRFGVSDEQYYSSLCEAPFAELGVSGKSGSFLYITEDQRFIVKSISESESQFFRRILQSYHDHIQRRPNSRLARFLGMYRLQYMTVDIRFVVMTNVFPPQRPIHERYDLKGSTVGRRTIQSGQFEPQEISEVIMKDIDLTKRMQSKIQLGKARKNDIMKTLTEDCEFMQQFNIMDYSLLFGVHYVTADSSVPESTEEPGRTVDGGYWAENLEGHRLSEIYYFQIIDILQPYNTMKQIERSMKSILYKKDQLSVQPAAQYATRFLNFIESVMV